MIDAMEIDKSKWGSGPWQDEPDRVEFEHLGFPCLIVRVPHGALCGYVAVPPGHPWHRRCYQTLDSEVDVHGGLTYSSECAGDVCHQSKPGEPDDVWWLGFDHAHWGDFVPGIKSSRSQARYRTIDYVRDQCERLTLQAKRVEGDRS